MTSSMPALNEVELDAVSGGLKKGEVCVGTGVVISTSEGTLTLGSSTCTIGGVTTFKPFGSWQPA